MTRAMEVLLMTLGGVWQGVRQDFNLLEIILVAVGIWLWRLGRFPQLHWRFPKIELPVLRRSHYTLNSCMLS